MLCVDLRMLLLVFEDKSALNHIPTSCSCIKLHAHMLKLFSNSSKFSPCIIMVTFPLIRVA